MQKHQGPLPFIHHNNVMNIFKWLGNHATMFRTAAVV
jgi:hypothetical protein